MPFSLLNICWLVAYPTRQAVQSMGSTSIIESKSLWLTKFSYLNDTTELKLAIDLFQASARKWIDKIEDEDKANFLKKSSDQLETLSNINVCIACFCENGDLLSQWRSYGNNGSGIALEFDANSLQSLSNTRLMNLWRCVYNGKEHREIIEELINLLLTSYDVVKNSCVNGDWEKAKEDLNGYFYTTFLRVAPIIKNHHFHEEKEWRLITVAIASTDENWFSRVSNNRVSQYYKLNFDKIDNGKYEFLKGAIVGPTTNPYQVGDAVWDLLRKNGYHHNHIHFSQIPYRS